MIKFEGKVWKADGRYWLVEVPDLCVMTQGLSRKGALGMIADAIEGLVDKKGFKIEIDKGKKDQFAIATKDTKAIIALLLKRRRAKQGLTIAEVASRMGAKSKNAYAQYEQGKSEPSLTKLMEILKAINPATKTFLKVA